MSRENEPPPPGGGAPETTGQTEGGLTLEHAALAYRIIQTLLTHTTVTQDLVALMARVLDEEAQDALVNTPHWAAYMDSRRALERAREDIDRFAQVWTQLAEEK